MKVFDDLNWFEKLLGFVFKDSIYGRKRSADRLRSRRHLIDQHKQFFLSATSSRNIFERCYALDVVSKYGKPEEWVPVLARELLSNDPFVREAAGAGFERIGKAAYPALSVLLEALEKHPSEGMSLHIISTFMKFDQCPEAILEAVKNAARAKDAYSPRDVWLAYLKLQRRI